MALLAPAIGFAQSNQFQSTYCTYYNSYTQYCEFFMGNSSLSIAQNGQVISNAVTEVNWAFIVNTNGCQNYSNGNPYACQPPQYPAPNVSVGTSISPPGTWGSATSGCGWGCALLQLTTQATQAGTYTEISNHNAYFPPSGDSLSGQTQQQQSYTPPQPTITSVSPNTWPTGAGTSVTISGSNFGSSPTVSLSGDGYVMWSQGSASADGTTITGTVTIDPNDPGGETVTVTVTAGGSGNGFAEGEQEGAQSNGANAKVARVPAAISSISPTQVSLGQTNAQLTIQGSGFGSAVGTVNLPSGVTNVGVGWGPTTIVVTVNVSSSATVGSSTITVTPVGGAASNGVSLAIDGPYFLTVEDDTRGYCEGCQTTIVRYVTYQITNYSGINSGTNQICEAPTNSGWNCTQPVQNYIYSRCSSPGTASGGQFTDMWSIATDGVTPIGCGFNITDSWMWVASQSSTPALATLTGYVHTNAVSINGSVSPPNKLTSGTQICPSGTTYAPGAGTCGGGSQ